jgi:hypothetical protein
MIRASWFPFFSFVVKCITPLSLSLEEKHQNLCKSRQNGLENSRCSVYIGTGRRLILFQNQKASGKCGAFVPLLPRALALQLPASKHVHKTTTTTAASAAALFSFHFTAEIQR